MPSKKKKTPVGLWRMTSVLRICDGCFLSDCLLLDYPSPSPWPQLPCLLLPFLKIGDTFPSLQSLGTVHSFMQRRKMVPSAGVNSSASSFSSLGPIPFGPAAAFVLRLAIFSLTCQAIKPTVLNSFLTSLAAGSGTLPSPSLVNMALQVPLLVRF
jgi:hypothetical protein